MSLTRPEDTFSNPTHTSHWVRPMVASLLGLYCLATPPTESSGCVLLGGVKPTPAPQSKTKDETVVGSKHLNPIPWAPEQGPVHAESSTEREPREPGWIMRVPDSLGPGPIEHAPVAMQDASDVRTARAFQFAAPIFSAPANDRKIIGVVRRNLEVEVLGAVPGPGCARGWLAVRSGGYICATEGFDTTNPPPPLRPELRSTPPDLNRALPFAYGQVLRDGAPVFRSLPTPQELALTREGQGEAVRALLERTHGQWVVAIDRRVDGEAGSFVRTVRGHYVQASDIGHATASSLYGEEFDPSGLPIAFVNDPDTPVFDVRNGRQSGSADRYFRFPVVELMTLGPEAGARQGLRVARGPGDFAMPLNALRVALPIRKPPGVPHGRKWIHVNLSEQTLTAYEGTIPVWTALASTGAGDFATPEGLFRIDKKYISHTMRGAANEGNFRVGQVPWVLYYWESFAIHGAFWHDDFGSPASHGCTNLSPLDARWLFFWAEPKLEAGWHGRAHAEGTWVHLSHVPASAKPDGIQRAHSAVAAR